MSSPGDSTRASGVAICGIQMPIITAASRFDAGSDWKK
jgi:hypothetical protein